MPVPLGRRRVALVAALYLGLAVVATWPLARDGADHSYSFGTPLLNTWAMAVVQHQLASQPLQLFEGNCFYPYVRSLAFSEHLLVPALLSWPIAAVSGNPLLAHNLLEIFTLALAGLGMFLLARELSGEDLGAFAAGVFYAFHTFNVNELARVQILSNQWFPLVLLGLLRFFARPSRAGAIGVAVAYALQSLSCMYWALYLPLLVVPTVLVLQWRRRLGARALAWLAVGLLVALAATALVAWPYVLNGRELGLARDASELQSLALDRYFDVLPGNWLYGWLGTARPNQDAAHFLGFTALSLAVVGGLAGRLRPGALLTRRWLVLLALVGLALSLGPEIRAAGRTWGPGPYALLYRYLPGFHGVRYPERFSVFLVLGLAPLVALGVARLRPIVGRAVCVALGAAVFLEHLSAPLPLDQIQSLHDLPSVYRHLRDDPSVRVVAELPATDHWQYRYDVLPMYRSLAHWKRTVQGFTGYPPPISNFLRWRLLHFPADASVEFLARLGVDTVVVAPDDEGRLPEWAGPDPRWTVVGPFPEGHLLLRLEVDEAAAGSTLAARFKVLEDALALRELAHDGWVLEASRPGIERAVDGDRSTAWSTGQAQRPTDFVELRFPRPVRVAQVSLSVAWPQHFPMRLRVFGRAEGGGAWERLRFPAAAAYDRLFASLLHAPTRAALVIDLPGGPLVGLRLQPADADPYWMPWDLHELKVFE